MRRSIHYTENHSRENTAEAVSFDWWMSIWTSSTQENCKTITKLKHANPEKDYGNLMLNAKRWGWCVSRMTREAEKLWKDENDLAFV